MKSGNDWVMHTLRHPAPGPHTGLTQMLWCLLTVGWTSPKKYWTELKYSLQSRPTAYFRVDVWARCRRGLCCRSLWLWPELLLHSRGPAVTALVVWLSAHNPEARTKHKYVPTKLPFMSFEILQYLFTWSYIYFIFTYLFWVLYWTFFKVPI